MVTPGRSKATRAGEKVQGIMLWVSSSMRLEKASVHFITTSSPPSSCSMTQSRVLLWASALSPSLSLSPRFYFVSDSPAPAACPPWHSAGTWAASSPPVLWCGLRGPASAPHDKGGRGARLLQVHIVPALSFVLRTSGSRKYYVWNYTRLFTSRPQIFIV